MSDAGPDGQDTTSPQDAEPSSAADLERLERSRRDLLRVHRALLTIERVRYEKVHGRVANNSAFLQLVIADPWFEWLRPMALLVLLIDERTSSAMGRSHSNHGSAITSCRNALLLATRPCTFS